MSTAQRCLTALVVVLMLLFCVSVVEGKGAGGARAGGGFRSYKGGSLSRTRYNGYYGVFFYRGAGYSGRRSGSAAVDPKDKESNVFCKRDVRLDHKSYTNEGTVTLNSTRDCFRQVTTTNGAPENVKVLATWLDVYQWTLSAEPNGYPVVTMRQFNDKDDPKPSPESIWSVALTRFTDEAGTVIDTSMLEWKSVRPAPLGKKVWGYPASYSLDFARLLTFAVEGKGTTPQGSFSCVLTFTISDDFAEEPLMDYVFFRPSSMKIDVRVTEFPFLTDEADLGLDLYVITKKNNLAVAQNSYVQYDPRLSERVEIGTLNDADVRGRHYLSWRASSGVLSLCQSAGGQMCVNMQSCTDDVTCTCGSQKLCATCGTGTKVTEACSKLQRHTPAGYTTTRLSFLAHNSSFSTFTPNGTVGSKVDLPIPYIDWSFVMGTYDLSETVARDPANGGAAAAPLLPFSLLLLLLLLSL